VHCACVLNRVAEIWPVLFVELARFNYACWSGDPWGPADVGVSCFSCRPQLPAHLGHGAGARQHAQAARAQRRQRQCVEGLHMKAVWLSVATKVPQQVKTNLCCASRSTIGNARSSTHICTPIPTQVSAARLQSEWRQRQLHWVLDGPRRHICWHNCLQHCRRYLFRMTFPQYTFIAKNHKQWLFA
jgi:hypothetical protein